MATTPYLLFHGQRNVRWIRCFHDFCIDSGYRALEKSAVPFAVDYFAKQLRTVTGYPLSVKVGREGLDLNCIVFDYVRDAKLGDEGYVLDVQPSTIRVQANSDAGHLYAVQTMLQLLPEGAFGTKLLGGMRWGFLP